MAVPNPAEFAAGLDAQRAGRTDSSIERALRVNFAPLVATCEEVGANVSELVTGWIEKDGLESVSRWVDPSTSDDALAAEWRSVGAVQAPNLLAALTQEKQLCVRGEKLGAFIRSNQSSYSAALLVARDRCAQALIQHSYEVPFHRPVVLTRVLAVAIHYLKNLIQLDVEPSSFRARRQRRELGRAIVTYSRFATTTAADLDLAKVLLWETAEAEQERSADAHWAHYLEACLALYHLTGDRQTLEDAVVAMSMWTVIEGDWPRWHLTSAEIWLALMEFSSTDEERRAAFRKAQLALKRVANVTPDTALDVRFRMVEAFVNFVRQDIRDLSVVRMRGVRFPHGLRTASRQMPPIFFEASAYLIEALRPTANRGSLIFRDFLAELLSFLARHRTATERQRQNMLEDAVRLRGSVAGKAPLWSAQEVLSQAADKFLLAEITSDPGLRRAAAIALANESHTYAWSPDPLLLMAREIETNGPVDIESSFAPADVVKAARTGDFKALYLFAALRAAKSPDLRKRGIGGRGGVVVVEDYSGRTGQSFVFKRMTPECLSRDGERAAELHTLLAEQGLTDRFGVIEHLATIDSSDDAEQLSVRRFVNGVTLRKLLKSDPARGRIALDDAAEYLAFFHASLGAPRSSESPQRAMRSRELGRWLKRVAEPDAVDGIFTGWMKIASRFPLVRRRDAHTLNWLVERGGRILAVDLDSIGCRPLGYELAQLSDDHPVFAPDDVESRRNLVANYVHALGKYGLDIELDLAWDGYMAGLGARAIGLMTDPDSSENERMHGFQLLEMVARDGAQDIAEWAATLRLAWVRRSGLIDPNDTDAISQADRARISRAMAFHLRHDSFAPLSREGWIVADELEQLLRNAGHRVTAEQLVHVAGAYGEPRFQLDGLEIRALYGHTVSVDIRYGDRKPPAVLFHATPTENMNSIFAARSGLQPMARLSVHLSDDADAAMRSASRRGQAVFCLAVEVESTPGIVHAAGHTWLAPGVAVASLSVMTMLEVYEMRRPKL